ncbi:MAG TPA: ABC transporter ATP-binding protein [Candidatus Omnitrophota bacterium]|nr:ABC transporter ATP-binding protein [Candidatus Omnitrophota bacterium]
MIEVHDLAKSFGKIRAVDGLTFNVQEGEIVGLLGPNGAGKTTAMRILTGFLTPTEGTVRINGLDMLKFPRKVQSILGYLPEDVPLYKDMTVESFLKFVVRMKGLPIRKRRDAIGEAVELCKLEDVRKRIIGKLSKGYRQRVGLAQALIGRPKVLILDEPTSGLDPRQINEIRQLIRNLKGKQTILLSTHILPEASMVSDRVLIINKGKLVATGTPKELADRLCSGQELFVTVRPSGKLLAPLVDKVPGVLSIQRMSVGDDGVERYKIISDKSQDVRSGIARALVAEGVDLVELRSEAMSLEDVFLKLVTQEDPFAAAEAESSRGGN